MLPSDDCVAFCYAKCLTIAYDNCAKRDDFFLSGLHFTMSSLCKQELRK